MSIFFAHSSNPLFYFQEGGHCSHSEFLAHLYEKLSLLTSVTEPIRSNRALEELSFNPIFALKSPRSMGCTTFDPWYSQCSLFTQNTIPD